MRVWGLGVFGSGFGGLGDIILSLFVCGLGTGLCSLLPCAGSFV